MLGAPAAARALVESTRVSHYRYVETNRHSLRNGFTAYTCPPRCPGFLATVAGGSSSANLIPASGDQDLTISPSAPAALVSRRQCVHRIPRPTFVTIGRSAPPERAGSAEINTLFGKTKAEFLRKAEINRNLIEMPDEFDGFSIQKCRSHCAAASPSFAARRARLR